MQINFISSKDSNETRNMHTKSDNTENMIGSETNDIIEELRDSLLQNYRKGLEESMRGSEFVIVLSSSENKFEKRRMICRFSKMAKR